MELPKLHLARYVLLVTDEIRSSVSSLGSYKIPYVWIRTLPMQPVTWPSWSVIVRGDRQQRKENALIVLRSERRVNAFTGRSKFRALQSSSSASSLFPHIPACVYRSSRSTTSFPANVQSEPASAESTFWSRDWIARRVARVTLRLHATRSPNTISPCFHSHLLSGTINYRKNLTWIHR